MHARTLISATAAALLLAPQVAVALDLPTARQQGLVCEQTDGFLRAKGAETPELKALVNEVNQRRKDEYAKISAQNGQTLDVVQKIAAGQILAKPGTTPCN